MVHVVIKSKLCLSVMFFFFNKLLNCMCNVRVRAIIIIQAKDALALK